MNQYSQMPYMQANTMGQQLQPYTGQMPYGYQMMPYTGQQSTGAQPMHGTGMGTHDWQEFCRRYRHYLVNMQTTDGQQYEGIIDGTDQENVYLLIPDGDSPDREEFDDLLDGNEEPELNNYYRYGGYGGFGGYPFPWYGYPRRFRRFRRYRFPFFRLGGFNFPIFF